MRLTPFVLMFVLTLAAATSRAVEPGLVNVLERLGVDRDAEHLQPAPIPGFLEVRRGMQVLYVAADGGLVIHGDILSITTETNLTEKRRGEMRRELLDRVPDDETVIVRPSLPAVARITVFTDVDCPYCLALHRRQDELLQQGIEIRYLFYPRSGPASTSFEQAVAVWCSDDRLAALGEALRGTKLPGGHCTNPVRRHYELARKLELKGTPAIIAADGSVQHGAYSPDDILEFAQGLSRRRR